MDKSKLKQKNETKNGSKVGAFFEVLKNLKGIILNTKVNSSI